MIKILLFCRDFVGQNMQLCDSSLDFIHTVHLKKIELPSLNRTKFYTFSLSGKRLHLFMSLELYTKRFIVFLTAVNKSKMTPFFAAVLPAFVALATVVEGDITGTNPSVGSCLCPSSGSLNIRDARKFYLSSHFICWS